MDEGLKFFIETIEIWHLGAIIVSVIAFMMLYMKANHTASLRAFLYVQFTVVLWMFSKVLKTISPTVDIRWFFIVLQYFAICLLEVAFLEFGYAYNKGRPIKKKIKILLYIGPLIQFLIVATNPYHYLFYASYDFYRDSFGILFYVHFFIEYIYIVIGAIYCGIKFNKQINKDNKVYMYLVSIGILAPIILNLIYVSKILHRFFKMINFTVVFDITPIVFTWSLLLFLYATFKNEFFELSPIMKHEIIYKLDTPICIVDSAYEILFANERLRNNLDINDMQKFGEYLEAKRDLFNHSDDVNKNNVIEYNGSYYKIYSKAIRNLSGKQYIISFNEVTSHILVKNQLTEKNEELRLVSNRLEEKIEILKHTSRIGARNFVSRELHDIIGHSLVVAIKLLEVTKLSFKSNKKMATNSIEKAKYSIISGFDEMKSVNEDKNIKKHYTGVLLEQEIGKMLKRVEINGIQTKFYFRGKISKLDKKIYNTINKVCIELITNTLKHAKASMILLSLNSTEKEINIDMMDNGLGKEKIIKGNGLKGINSRLELIGGWAKYNSNPGEGFSAHISIPR